MLATTSILFISAAFLYLTTHCICHSSRLCFDIKRGENISMSIFSSKKLFTVFSHLLLKIVSSSLFIINYLND